MPEGDTIRRTASTLNRALAGRVVTAYHSREPAAAADDLLGRTVLGVEARGKNLLLRFDDGRVLHSHLVMRGAWHIYRPGERWWKPSGRAAVVIETAASAPAAEGFIAVLFDTTRVALMDERQAARAPELASLGPDILAEVFDEAAALARYLEVPELPIGEAVMLQRLTAGIGNIYKSESLFVARVHPWTTVAELGAEGTLRVLRAARELMQDSLQRGRRRISAFNPSRTWVYGRSGEPCSVCGSTIEISRQGDLGRTTYFCPSCQPPAAPAPG